MGRVEQRPRVGVVGMMNSPVRRSTFFRSSTRTFQKVMQRYHSRHHQRCRAARFAALHGC